MSTAATYPRLDESLLSHMPPFKNLDRTAIRAILDQASSRHLDAGTTVFEEGANADRFFILLDGYVRVLRLTADGEQVILLHIPPGQLFGIAVALGRTTYPATAVTAADAIVLSWPSAIFGHFKSSYPEFATATYDTIGLRLADRNDRLISLATQRVEQRVASVLVQLSNQNSRAVAEGAEIPFPLSRQDLSEMTATTLHTVSRLLSAWEKEGIIRSRRKRITVLSAENLERIAHRD